MEFYELCNKINLPQEILAKINAAYPNIHFIELNPLLDQLMHIATAPAAYDSLCTLFADDKENIHLLICSLECARRQYDVYMKMGIAEEIFIDTMKCFSRFAEECKVRNGSYYFDRGWWTYRHISMTIFRIGALEYELKEHNGDNAISLHIPSDADFHPESVDTSLTLAKQFLNKYYPEYADSSIICDSWLLAPALKDLLTADSNIIGFQNRFDIFKTRPEAMDCLEWVFKVPADTPFSALPEQTSLQRKIKQALLRREHVGVGYGIMK